MVAADKIERLNEALLMRLEWRRFEELMQAYFNHVGWRADRAAVGPDGGIDINLYKDGEFRLAGCVQCKAYGPGREVSVKEVREFFGAMTAQRITLGYYATTSCFTDPARAFAEENGINLLDGKEILRVFEELPQVDRGRVIAHVFRGDFETPTCASCDVKMVWRESFWGCRNFPRCHKKMYARQKHQA